MSMKSEGKNRAFSGRGSKSAVLDIKSPVWLLYRFACHKRFQSVSSVVEHYLDTVGVSSSNLLLTTIFLIRAFKELCSIESHYAAPTCANEVEGTFLIETVPPFRRVALIRTDR